MSDGVKRRGSRRMSEQGYQPVQIWLPRSWHGWVKYTAGFTGLPLATFARLVCLAAACDERQRRLVSEQLTYMEKAQWRRICQKVQSLKPRKIGGRVPPSPGQTAT